MLMGDTVLRSVLQREQINLAYVTTIQDYFKNLITDWELYSYVIAVKPSGSFAKGTAIKSSADVDLFISLSAACSKTLEEIYDSLNAFLSRKRIRTRKQNVSIRCFFFYYNVDLVPGKRNSRTTTTLLPAPSDDEHWLYVRKQSSRQKTNISVHISMVRNSGCTDVIRLVKIWREKQHLEFPSLYLEMVVIEALKDKQMLSTLDDQFRTVLIWIVNNIDWKRFEDPANTNNIISNDLSAEEKKVVKRKAQETLYSNNWQEVFR